jgi:hypothetical protein
MIIMVQQSRFTTKNKLLLFERACTKRKDATLNYSIQLAISFQTSYTKPPSIVYLVHKFNKPTQLTQNELHDN